MKLLVLEVLALCLMVRAVKRGTECNFESGLLCDGWLQGLNGVDDDLDWSVWNERARAVGSKNDEKDVPKNGHYLQLESIKSSKDQRALFASPVLTPSNNVVNVTFWYAMNGSPLQNLKVYLKDLGLTTPYRLLWSTTLPNRQGWEFIILTSHVTGPFRLIFEGSIAGPEGQVAIDDIALPNTDVVDLQAPPDIRITRGNASGHKRSDWDKKIVLSTTTATDGNGTKSTLRRDILVIAAVGGCIFWLGILGLLIYFICKTRSKYLQRGDYAKPDNMMFQDEHIYHIPEVHRNYAARAYNNWMLRHDVSHDYQYVGRNSLEKAKAFDYATVI